MFGYECSMLRAAPEFACDFFIKKSKFDVLVEDLRSRVRKPHRVGSPMNYE